MGGGGGGGAVADVGAEKAEIQVFLPFLSEADGETHVARPPARPLPRRHRPAAPGRATPSSSFSGGGGFSSGRRRTWRMWRSHRTDCSRSSWAGVAHSCWPVRKHSDCASFPQLGS